MRGGPAAKARGAQETRLGRETRFTSCEGLPEVRSFSLSIGGAAAVQHYPTVKVCSGARRMGAQGRCGRARCQLPRAADLLSSSSALDWWGQSV